MPINTNGGILIDSPAGTTSDFNFSKQLALLKQLQAQADTETANAAAAKTKARLADPVEAAKAADEVARFQGRKDVQLPEMQDTALPPVRGIQRVNTAAPMGSAAVPPMQDTPFGQSQPPMRAITRVGTSNTTMAAKGATEDAADPNASALAKQARDRAMLDPRVLAAEAAAQAKGGTNLLGAVPGVTGEAALEGQPEQTKNIVKLLTDYKMALPSGMALRTPEWQNYISLAKAADPSFDATQYGVRQKLRNDFTSGTASKNIRSLNTAVAHLDTLSSKADALNNYSSLGPLTQLANRGKNWLSSESGNPAVTEFQAAATAVANELATTFKGTAGTDPEIKAWRDSVNAAQSPAQLHGAVATGIQLLRGRLGAMEDQYKQGMGKPAEFDLLSEKSKAVLAKLEAKLAGGGGAITGTGNIKSITPLP